MDKKTLRKVSVLKRWPFLNISILLIGGFVIFGLGFALGLHYAQNEYLGKKKSKNNKVLINEYKSSTVKDKDEYTFHKILKEEFNHKEIGKNDDTIVSKNNRGKKNALKNKENKRLDLIENVLPESKSEYTIQVYSFKSQELSERKVLELKKRGFPAYQSKKDFGHNGIHYRVRVGQFKKRDEAAEILEEILESETKEAYITRN